MPYRLPVHVSFCVLGGQIVFLDLVHDRYVQLPPRLCAALRALQSADVVSLDSQAVRALLDQGLIEEYAQGHPLAPTQAPAPTQSLLEQENTVVRVRPGHLITIAADLCQLKRSLSARRLSAAVGALESLKRARCDRAEANACDVARVTHAFLAARRLLPVPSVCLIDSLALAQHLSRRGASVDLIFGVKLNPFYAHAWVQWDGMVLNDSLDRALAHQPIRVT